MKYGLECHVVARINAIFAEIAEIDAVFLYGSRAKGNWKHGSDIDLCIKGEEVTLPLLFAIENKIDDLLLPYKVDLALFHKIENPGLVDHITRVGVPIYVRQATQSQPTLREAHKAA